MNFLTLYKTLTNCSEPFVKYILKNRISKGKEDSTRYTEKMGITNTVRPSGKLVWIHAVSLGESLSALPLVEQLLKLNVNVLVTTTTVTSAEVMKDRLPSGVIHQYCPIDVPKWVDKFLNHWQPDMVMIMESELWINILTNLHNREIPTFLINARFSNKSMQKWIKFPQTANKILSLFTQIYAQTNRYADFISKLTDKKVIAMGNVKYSAPLPPIDNDKLALLRQQIGNRPIWIAISTHPEDEDFIKSSVEKLHKIHDDLLTIIMPRHPNRAVEIYNKFNSLNPIFRSKNDIIDDNTSLYIADTIGEVGTFLTLCPISFVGGSTDGGYGGHNVLEPANMGSAIVQGMDTAHFADVTKSLSEQNAHIQVKNSDELFVAIDKLLTDKELREQQIKNAKVVGHSHIGIAKNIVDNIKCYLD